MVRWLLQELLLCIPHRSILTEQFRHYGILFMNTFHNEVNILFTYPLFSQSPSSPHDKEQIGSSFLRFALADVFEKNEKKNKTTCVYRLCGQFYTVSSCTKKARASIVLNIERVQYYLSCKSVKTCTSIGLNRAKKSKICVMSVLKKKSLIVLCISDNTYKK